LQLSDLQLWEILAVVLGILYLVLAIRQNIWCWAAAAASTSLYLFIMFEARLYMESALQVFYIAMAAYGWHEWRHGGEQGGELAVSTWPIHFHVLAIACLLIVVAASGELLSRFSDAALPFLDSLTTWGAIFATWMVARKLLENWIYWFVIDSVAIYLYIDRGLYFTAAMFAGYLVMIVIGYRSWRASMSETPA
jgi:nicotinamide mononucleotide transporter